MAALNKVEMVIQSLMDLLLNLTVTDITASSAELFSVAEFFSVALRAQGFYTRFRVLQFLSDPWGF